MSIVSKIERQKKSHESHGVRLQLLEGPDTGSDPMVKETNLSYFQWF